MIDIDTSCTDCIHMYVCKFMDDYNVFADKAGGNMWNHNGFKEPSCAEVKIACKYFLRKEKCVLPGDTYSRTVIGTIKEMK